MINLLKAQAVSGKVYTSRLILTDPYLTAYVRNNLKSLQERLGDEITIVDDLKREFNYCSLPHYLRRKYGNEVNLTHLREHDKKAYASLSFLGNARTLLHGWGFRVEYGTWETKEQLKEQLKLSFSEFPRKLYYKAYYRGFDLPKTDNSLVIEAKKLRKKGLSYRKIAEKLKVPKSTVHYWLKGGE